jgi:cyclophilin family peptidyl-prolyl cis-trans isomerase
MMTRITFTTSLGAFTIEMDTENAPLTSENIVQYARDGFYNNSIVHRVVPNFVIQMGGYDADLNHLETRPPIANEWQNGLKNVRGALSMARTEDPGSATSQFFINLKDNDYLDEPVSGGAGYAVFGRVSAGMDVIDKIAAAGTKEEPALGGMPCPSPRVVIEKAEVVS